MKTKIIKMETTIEKIGKIKPFKIQDQISGLNIEIKASEWFTIIIVNDREFYFNSDTGEFDGTGQECNPPIEDD